MKNPIGLIVLSLGLFGLVFLTNCKTDPSYHFEEVDLMKHGLPLKVKAPAEMEVEKSTTMGQQDYLLDGGEDYFVQVFVSDFNSGSRENLVEELKNNISGNRFFNGFLVEEEDGFIYEFKIDTTNSNFGFRRVHIQGDKEYIFQNGMGKIFSEEQATGMFEAVAQ